MLKHEITAYMKKLYEKGFTSSLSGNVSVRDEGTIYISPSKVPKYRILESQVSVVTIEGEHVEGAKPSSELLTHLAIYRTSDAKAIIHVHSHYATILACLKRSISPIEVECRELLNFVPVISYTEPGSIELGVLISEGLKGHKGVLLENHGSLTIGVDLEEAFILTEALERAARLQFEISLVSSR